MGNPLFIHPQTTWNGGGTDGNWNTPTNWTSFTAPVSGDALLFSGTTRLSNSNNIAGLTLNGITFSNNAGAFVITGNVFTLTNSLLNLSTNAQTINQAFSLGSPVIFNASNGVLALTGNITNGGNLLTIDGQTNITLSGILTGSAGIQKNGTNRLTLSGANTFVGNLTNANGIIQIGADNNLGNTANDMVFNGGTLNVTAGFTLNAGRQLLVGSSNIMLDVSAGTLTLGTASQVTNGGIFVLNSGAVSIGNGNAIHVGTILQVGDGVGAANSAVFTVNGGMAGGVGLSVVVSNDGQFVQGNNRLVRLNTLSGNGNVSINAAAGQGFDIQGAGTNTFSGVISAGVIGSTTASAGSRLHRYGSGLQILSGNNTYVSRTYITDGRLNIQNDNALGQFGTTVVSNDTAIYNTGTLQIQGGLTNVREVLLLGLTGNTALGFNGQGAINNIADTNTLAGSIVVSNTASIQSSSGLLQIAGNLTNFNSNLTFFGSGNIGLSGASVLSGAGSITKDGSGTLTYGGTNANTYTGNTVVSNGVLLLDKPTGTNAIAAGLLSVYSGGTVQLNASNLIANGVNLTLSGGTLDLNNYNETMGTLDSQGFTVISKIKYGTSTTTNVLSFTDSSALLWSTSAVIYVQEYSRTATFDQLFVGVTPASITDEQIGKIRFIDPNGLSGNFAAVRGAAGEIVPHTSGDFIWINSGSGYWTNAADWDSGYVPDSDGARVLFGTNILSAATIFAVSPTNFAVNQINLAGNNVYTLSNNIALNFRSSGTNDPSLGVRTGSANHVIDSDLTVYTPLASGNRFYVSNNGTGLLTLNGNVALNNQQMVVDGSNDIIFNGVISGTNAGATNVTVNSGGLITFGGASANLYTGLTAITRGTLLLDKSDTVTALPGDALISNATLRLASDEQIANGASLTLQNTAKLDLNGHVETLNGLALSGTNNIIDFGNSAFGSTLTISNLALNGNSLYIYNWTGTVSETNNLDRFYATYDAGLFSYTMFFYADEGISLIGVGVVDTYDMGGGLYQFVPIPEPYPGWLFAVGLILFVMSHTVRNNLRRKKSKP
ncbi:MAG: hypothetical protein SFY92_11610 [Verrucomicrobiae bacterium]|nr:hypothetical protein [Verrucomicrobiae bacterium]